MILEVMKQKLITTNLFALKVLKPVLVLWLPFLITPLLANPFKSLKINSSPLSERKFFFLFRQLEEQGPKKVRGVLAVRGESRSRPRQGSGSS
jgi:hypothetical protein